MIPVYGSLITMLLCTSLPPIFDYSNTKKEDWSWKRAVVGYGVMTGVVLVLPVLIGGSVYVMWVLAAIAVAIAICIAPVSLVGTTFVLLLSSVILPALILWDISRYNKINEPLSFVLSRIEWPRFLAPMAFGLVTFFVVKRLCQKLRQKERHPTAA